jgi:excisionase family DNA binding protein
MTPTSVAELPHAAPRPEGLPHPLLLTVSQAAALLALPRTKIYPLIMTGEIASLKIGRSRRIPYIALERWIEQQLAA